MGKSLVNGELCCAWSSCAYTERGKTCQAADRAINVKSIVHRPHSSICKYVG